MKSKTFLSVVLMAAVACLAGLAHADVLGMGAHLASMGIGPGELLVANVALAVPQLRTFDQATIDSTGVFFSNELMRISPTLIEPLADFPYARDVDLTPLDLGDESTAYDSVAYRAAGGVNPVGKSIISARTTVIGAANVDSDRLISPTFLWGELFQMSIIEIERAMKLGRPLSPQLLNALKMKWEIDSQGMVYLGDAALGVTGLVNSTAVTAATVAATGTGSSTLWSTKTPDQINDDINTLITAVWASSGYTRIPNRIGLPPQKLAYLNSVRITNTGESLLAYVKRNNTSLMNGQDLSFAPIRELVGAGSGSTDRMIAYTKAVDVVRYPRSELRALPLQYDGLFQKQIYVGRLGTIEIPRPQLLRYADGI
jgi:hypothetical protein